MEPASLGRASPRPGRRGTDGWSRTWLCSGASGQALRRTWQGWRGSPPPPGLWAALGAFVDSKGGHSCDSGGTSSLGPTCQHR